MSFNDEFLKAFQRIEETIQKAFENIKKNYNFLLKNNLLKRSFRPPKNIHCNYIVYTKFIIPYARNKLKTNKNRQRG